MYELTGRGPPPLSAPGCCRAWADPLRWPRRGTGATPRGARPSGAGPRSGRGYRGRPRRGEVPPGLGSHPLPPRPRVAGPPGQLGLLRQGDVLSASDRPAQRLLRDRGPRRPTRGAREADGEAPDAGPDAGAQPATAPIPPRRADRRPAVARPRPAATAPADPGRGEAAPLAREPGSSRSWSSSRISTGSTPRPRRSSTVWSRACRPPGSSSLSTTGRSTSTSGVARRTTRSSGSTRSRPRAPTSCSSALTGRRRRPRAAHAAADPTDRGQSRSSSRRASAPSSRPVPWRASAEPTDLTTAYAGHPGAGDGAGHPRRPDRPAPVAGEAPPPGRVGRSVRTCRAPLLQAIADAPTTHFARASAHLQAAEFLYETSLYPRARVHLQARPHPRGGIRRSPPGSASADLHARIVRGHRTARHRGPPRRTDRAARRPRPPRRARGRRRPNTSAKRGSVPPSIGSPVCDRLAGAGLAALEHCRRPERAFTAGSTPVRCPHIVFSHSRNTAACVVIWRRRSRSPSPSGIGNGSGGLFHFSVRPYA